MTILKSTAVPTVRFVPVNSSDGSSPMTGKRLLKRAITDLVSWIENANEKNRSRRHLSQLDERLLNDIGISQKQAKIESAKPFWE